MKEVIFTPDAPNPHDVPYNQGVKANGFVFAGQGPHIPGGSRDIVEGGVEEQARQCLENLSVVLDEAGTEMENVVKASIYLGDMDDYETVNEIYRGYFEEYPSRVTHEVGALPFGDIAITVIAVVDE